MRGEYNKEQFKKNKINNFYKKRYANAKSKEHINKRINIRNIDIMNQIKSNLDSRICKIFRESNIKIKISYEKDEVDY